MLPQLKELLQKGTYQPAPGSVPLTLGSLEIAQAERTAKCRVILTAEQTVPYLDNLCTVIKVRMGQWHPEFWSGITVVGKVAVLVVELCTLCMILCAARAAAHCLWWAVYSANTVLCLCTGSSPACAASRHPGPRAVLHARCEQGAGCQADTYSGG